MRAILLALPLVVIFAATTRADEASDLRDRAIKAYAKDPADIKKMRVYSLKAKGISITQAGPAPALFEMTAGFPDHLLATWEMGTGANKMTVTMCGVNDRGWKKINSMGALEMSVESVTDFISDAYAVGVSTLITLNDPASKFTSIGKAKVGDDPVVGLKITHGSRPDIVLFFHEKTGLLRKMAYRSRDGGVTTTKEMIYDGHKDIGGLMLPTRQTTLVDGKELYTWTEMEYKFLDKLDQKLFVLDK